MLDVIVSADLDFFESELARFKAHFERGRWPTELPKNEKSSLLGSQHVDSGTQDDLSESVSANLCNIETDSRRLIDICQVLIKNFKDS